MEYVFVLQERYIFFDPRDFQVKAGDHVIVETARGIEYGTVVEERRKIKEKCLGDELKPVIRIATEEDDRQAEKNRNKEKDAYKICLQKNLKIIIWK